MIDAAIDVPDAELIEGKVEEIPQIPEISQEEWEALLEKDSTTLSSMQVIQRDRPLARAAQKGDAEAWTRLWQFYEIAIVKKIREFFWDQDDTFDGAQAIYVRAYQKIHTYNADKKFYNWITMVVRNFSLNMLKHQNVVKMIHVGSLNEHDMYNMKDDLGIEPCLEDRRVVSARDECAKAEEIENLYKCIENLTPNHKEIINMKHFQEIPYKEIAVKLNIPIGTVMSRLFNARAELAAIWNDIIDDLPTRKNKHN